SKISYSGSKVLRSTPIPLEGRSRTCPIDAFTTKSSPRYLLIVLALAGDSTMTRDFLPFFLAIEFVAAATVLSVHRGQSFTFLRIINPRAGRQSGNCRRGCQADRRRDHLVVRGGSDGVHV